MPFMSGMGCAQRIEEAVAISPPSDIVLDVIKAADPQSVRQAHETLAKSSVQVASAGDAKAAGAAFERSFGAARLAGGNETGADSAAVDPATRSSYEKFEAMVLQNFVKSMLPQDAETFFGEGTAGDMWKGMMAEELGTMLAKGGGIGIAESLLRQAAERQGAPDDVATSDAQGNLATALLQELQRTTLDGWGADTEDERSGSSLWG